MIFVVLLFLSSPFHVSSLGILERRAVVYLEMHDCAGNEIIEDEKVLEYKVGNFTLCKDKCANHPSCTHFAYSGNKKLCWPKSAENEAEIKKTVKNDRASMCGIMIAPHTFPWMVVVNGICTGVLVAPEGAKKSEFVIASKSCIVFDSRMVKDDVKLGSFNDDIGEKSEVKIPIKRIIYYDAPDDMIDTALLEMERPVDFNDYIRPIALPQSSTVPNEQSCKVVGWLDRKSSKSIKNSNLTVTSVSNVIQDSDCKGIYKGQDLKRSQKMCLNVNENSCQYQTGSAFLCSAKVSGDTVWSLHGYQSTGSRCPQGPLIYTNVAGTIKLWINAVMKELEQYKQSKDDWIKATIMTPPTESASNDAVGKIILKVGQQFSYPLPYDFKPIENVKLLIHDLSVDLGSVASVNGFHFADVIGYGVTDTVDSCLLLCHSQDACYAVNYVSSNGWCVLLRTAERFDYNIPMWSGADEGLESQHLIFLSGKKANPPTHKPRTDGEGKLLPAGTSPRFSVGRSRIIGGKAAPMFQYPWLVKIEGCGASLINEDLSNGQQKTASQLLVTAAHCVAEIGDRNTKLKKMVARLGCYREDLVQDVEQDIPVTKAIIHNDYGTGGWSDIALLEIAQPVKFNNYIGPVALPKQNTVPSRPKQCMAIGWGDTNTDDGPRPINEINVEVFSTEQCSNFHQAGDYATKDGWLKNRVLCASAKRQEDYHSVCSGDSGGPMFCSETIDGKPVQVLYGISSFVFGCVSKAPAGFTNVSSLMDWLASSTAKIKQQKANTVTFL